MQVKKIIAFCLATLILLSTCGCNSQLSDSSTTTNTDVVDVTDATQAQNNDDIQETYNAEQLVYTENQRMENSVAMLNYIMILTEKIKQSQNSKLYLEEIGDSMLDDFYPNAIDGRTKDQILSLFDNVSSMKMIAVKRERLAYIYNQNKAQAISKAIPSPMSILNIVQSGTPLKALASAAYLAIDSLSSYENTNNAIEMQYLQDGWGLDDDMSRDLDQLKSDTFSYLQDIVNKYNIEGDLTLSSKLAKGLVEWENNENVDRRIEYLKNHPEYRICGYYWLLLSKSCYQSKDYKGCIDAIDTYIETQPRLFRRDAELAKVLPKAIASLSEVSKGDKLIEKEIKYVSLLSSNVALNDWASRYYAAVTYLDLYAKTQNKDYLVKAHNAAKTNVNEAKNTSNSNWINSQLNSNENYRVDVKKVEEPKDATKEKLKEIKDYNKMLKEVRKTELPPVDNSLLLNVKLMLDTAKQLKLSDSEMKALDNIIHSNDSKLFLVDTIDNNLWSSKNVKPDKPEITFERGKITVPANCVCSKSVVSVSINGKKIETSKEWTIDSVKRKGDNPSNYVVTYENHDVEDAKYNDGDKVTVSIQPYEDYSDSIEASFQTKVKKVIFSFYSFERMV